MELTMVQILYLLWDQFHNAKGCFNAPCVSQHEETISLDFFYIGVYIVIDKEIFDSFNNSWSEDDFPMLIDIKPYDVIAPYRREVLKQCKNFEKSMLTIQELAYITNVYDRNASEALDRFTILKNDALLNK